YATLAEFSQRGVLALLADSTNVERPGWGDSERQVGEAFYRLFAEAQGRILVTCFASNLHRIQQVFDTAALYGRKVVVLGRRMEQNVQIASELGYLHLQPDTWVPFRRIEELEDHETVVLTTGSQGEPLSALSLMAQEEYPRLKIQPGDMVILSATPIPGNESLVWRTVNRLIRLGARVVYDQVTPVHVSGHAYQEELKLMLSMLKPRYLAPVHGEPRHQALYKQMALQMGYQEEQIFLLENGQVLCLDESGARIVDRVPVGRLLVEEGTVGGVPEEVLYDRRHLAHEGMLVAVVSLSAETGEIVAGPDLIRRGFEWNEPEEEEAARRVVWETLQKLNPAELGDWDAVRAELASVLKRFCRKHLNRRPMVIPIVMEV
ncbi:MAG: ribonuclease J, partial [candidate division WOR-3 bacterium]